MVSSIAASKELKIGTNYLGGRRLMSGPIWLFCAVSKFARQVQIEARRQQLANKEQQGQSRLNSQRQAMVLKAEERRRKREQRQEMAMQRRLERERQQQEQSKCRMKKYEKVANKAMEDRVKDEREKQRLRWVMSFHYRISPRIVRRHV